MRLSTSNTARLFSTSGTFGEIQIVSTPDKVLLDVQTRGYDTQARLRCEHALANLSIETAERLRDLLAEAVQHARSVDLDSRQPGLWSPATTAAVAARFGGVRS